MSCEICCEEFNRSNRKPVKCSCGYDMCCECAIKYILDSTNPVTHCMNCKHEWNREFLDANFTKKFLTTEYRVHCENIFFDRERILLPETQELAESIKLMKKLYNKAKTIVVDWNEKYNALRLERNNIHQNNRIGLDIAEFYFSEEDRQIEVEAELVGFQQRIRRMNARVIFLRGIIENPETIHERFFTQKRTTVRREFIRTCPNGDCKGFLSTQWKCGMCECHVCKDCHEVKMDENHVCNEDSVKTVALLAKDTRTCPKCAANIFKIDGCSQVWCTQCHTAFDFRTGVIETHVHNPHYYEYLRQTGQEIPRAIGDRPPVNNCDTIPPMYRQFKRMGMENHKSVLFFGGINSMYNHIRLVELPKYNVNRITTNLDLRLKYMLSEIDEAHFKQQLIFRDKRDSKKREMRDVMNMYQTVTLDILNKIPPCKTEYEVVQIVEEQSKLLLYFNKCMGTISKRYSCVAPRIEIDDKLAFSWVVKK